MATKYIDVAVAPGINNVPAASTTSTVTNKVRVAWDTTVTREQLHTTLQEIANSCLDANAQSAGFAD